jgi:hypothetical protein
MHGDYKVQNLFRYMLLHCYSYFIKFFWITYYLSADSVPVYVKFVGCNLEDSHRHHVGNCCLTTNILYTMCKYVYELSPYRITHYKLKRLIICRHQIDGHRKFRATEMLFYTLQK